MTRGATPVRGMCCLLSHLGQPFWRETDRAVRLARKFRTNSGPFQGGGIARQRRLCRSLPLAIACLRPHSQPLGNIWRLWASAYSSPCFNRKRVPDMPHAFESSLEVTMEERSSVVPTLPADWIGLVKRVGVPVVLCAFLVSALLYLWQGQRASRHQARSVNPGAYCRRPV